jgi:Toprim domain-containing protein
MIGAGRPEKKVHDATVDRQRAKARWLWARRQPLIASVAERYLRETRGYGGALPESIGYLPESGEHCACMISALGLSTAAGEIELQAVHLTKLAPDGRKAGTESDKIVVGSPRGAPIVLAPVNDGLGLIIAEGIEDALSVHEATGMGAWAAGSAPLLPYLADVVPNYVECVTCIVDDDKAGRRKSDELAAKLEARGIEARLFYPARSRAA